MINRTLPRFVLILILAVSGPVFGQLRHVEGIKTIGANVGLTGSGNFINVEATRLFTGSFYGKAGIGGDFGEVDGVKYSSLFIDLSALHTLVHFSEQVFINGQAGITGSTDRITNTEGTLGEAVLKFGGFIGAEVEVFFSDKYILVLNGNQRFLLDDEFGSTRYFIGLGFRISI